jgi:hypothetical protein
MQPASELNLQRVWPGELDLHCRREVQEQSEARIGLEMVWFSTGFNRSVSLIGVGWFGE